MVKRYIDWNGSGSIDPIDIAVAHAQDKEPAGGLDHTEGSAAEPHAQASGCLSSALVAMAAIVALPLLAIAVL